MVDTKSVTYEAWLRDVDEGLKSINMPREDWQRLWPYDFRTAFDAGAEAKKTAMKANRFWWKRQNEALGQECRKTPGCWLPGNHQEECQPV